MERGDEQLVSNKWVSGCLYADSEGNFAPATKARDSAVILAFLVSAAGVLYVSCAVFLSRAPLLTLRSKVYELPNLDKPIYVAEGLAYLPPTLSTDLITRRGTPKESISEILVADVGDTTDKSPHLVVSEPEPRTVPIHD